MLLYFNNTQGSIFHPSKQEKKLQLCPLQKVVVDPPYDDYETNPYAGTFWHVEAWQRGWES